MTTDLIEIMTRTADCCSSHLVGDADLFDDALRFGGRDGEARRLMALDTRSR